MPTKPIPFVNQQESAYDALAGGSPASLNVVVDAKGTVRRRPGLATYAEAPAGAVDASGIAGLYCPVGRDLYAVGADGAERPIYRVASGGAVQLTGDRSGVRGTGRPTFAETEMLLVVAGGNRPQKVVLADNTSSRLGGSPPNGATHVVANASRLLLNDPREYPTWVRYSGVATGAITYAGHEQWTQGVGLAGNISAESRPDRVVAVGEINNEVVAFGATSVQQFAPDPVSDYSPTATREYGCIAPYSPVRVDGSYGWLDDRRRFVIGDGRNVEPISTPIQTEIDALAVVDDCFGYRILTSRVDALVWTFPAERRTFAYQKGSGWGVWTSGGLGRWNVNAHFLRQDTHTNVVGLLDGRICRVAEGVDTDLGDPILARVTTGFLSRDTDNRKHCEGIRLLLRRDAAVGGTSLLVEWRDEPDGSWEGPLEVLMDRATERSPVVDFRSLGTYRQRQWRFTFSGSDDLSLISATETYRVLDY
jgi:hypothetical protein